MPEDFWFPAPDTELWTPLALNESFFSEKERGSRFLEVIARLKPGVSLDQAQADMDRVAARLSEAHPDTYTRELGFGVSVISRNEEIVSNIRPTLLVLLGAVAFVLLIACANIANLLLARAASRQREIAVRMAMGASRARILRQLLTESLLLSMAGGAAGLLLALWGVDVLVALIPRGEVPRLEEVGIDLTVLAFTLGVSILTGLLFGLAPALQTSRPNLNEALKEGGRTSTAAAGRSLHNVLIVSQVAMTLVLLVGAGLLVKSFVNLLKVNPGFDPENVLTMQVTLPQSKYPERRDQSAFFRQMIERVSSLAGVERAAAVTALPLSGWSNDWSFSIEGRAGMDGLPNQVLPAANYVAVSPDYFRAMGIPLLRGRVFTEAAEDESAGVIINEAMARRYFAGEEALGKRIKMGSQQSPYPWTEIIGVAADVKHSRLDNETRPEMYFSYANQKKPRMSAMFLVARAERDPLAMAAGVRGQILQIDGDQPVANVSTMGQIVSNSIAQRRFNMLLLGILAALALVMAAVGLYGIIAYSVNRRTHEIGVRMALGATSGDIFKLIIGRGVMLTLIGVAIGLGGAYAITRVISSWLARMLYEVSATDAAIFISIPALLVAVALAASYAPARRATKVDPMEALRYE
jgi:putative ABC transport system permease protein